MFRRVAVLLMVFATVTMLAAKNKSPQNINEALPKTGTEYPVKTLVNIGNISYWLYNDGKSGTDPDGNAGGIYPRGTAGVIYQDGLVWGAKVNGNIMVGGQTYRVGTQAMLDRIYRIRRDWATLTKADVFKDALELRQIPLIEINSDLLRQIIDQYKKDWRDWPVGQGAPYVDVNNNDIYDPVTDSEGMPDFHKGDYPGIKDAAQVVWLKVNDQDAVKTNNLYGSDPMGVEISVTVWAYEQPAGPIGQAIFKKYKLKNISTDIFNDMYLSQWSDPDIGNYTNDLVGCDSVRNAVFAYNGEPQDVNYNNYQLPPPAFGYTLLQGPIIPSVGDTAFFDFQKIYDFKNLSMTSFGYFSTGNSEWTDPALGSYDGTLQWYNLLRGFISNTNVDSPTPFTHYASGEATKFPLNGNPVSGSGDIDGKGPNYALGDRRMLLATGPFTMKPGETQEMVVALVGGAGNAALNSIQILKNNMDYIQTLYRAHQIVPSLSYYIKKTDETHSRLFLTADLVGAENIGSCTAQIESGYATYPSLTVSLYDDGLHHDGLADDGIWADSLLVSNRKYPSYVNLDIDESGQVFHYGKVLAGITLRQTPVLGDWQINWEDGRQDKKINTGETVKLNFAVFLKNNLPVIDTLTIIQMNENILFPSLTPGVDLHDDALSLKITAADTADTVDVWYQMDFDHNHTYGHTTLPVAAWEQPENWKDTLSVKNIVGKSKSCYPVVADPSLITGHPYAVTFFLNRTDSLLYWNLKDVQLDRVILKNQLLLNGPEHDFPITEGIEWKIFTSLPAVEAVVEISNGNGPLSKSEWDEKGAPFKGNNVWLSLSSMTDANRFYISAGGGDGTHETAYARYTRNIANLGQHDVEIRFIADSSDSKYMWWYDSDVYQNISFKAYDVGVGTYGDESDDVRLITGGYSGGSGVGVFGFDGYTDPVFGFPATDWLYLRKPVNEKGTYEQFDADLTSGTYSRSWWSPNSEEVLARLTFADFGGAGTLPEPGTVIRFITKKYFEEGDSLIIHSDVSAVQNGAPRAGTFQLYQNYPNPFNPSTQIRYQLPTRSKVLLTVFNLLGQKVRTLVNTKQQPGNYRVLFDGNGLASGIYIYRIKAGGFSQSRKMLFIK